MAGRRLPRAAPERPFTALIDRAAARFPEYPPDAGTIDVVIPHLTVVESDSRPLDEVVAAAQAALPFEAAADALEVLAEGDDGRWRRRWRLPFRL
jgi:hypothetical protein